MTCRTGTLLRLVAEAYDDFELVCKMPTWCVSWDRLPWEDYFEHTYWRDTPDDALLAALEHHWAKQ